MPNWKTHLELGTRVNKYLQFTKEDQELFLLGNILPDVNNNHLVTNVATFIPHDVTHFKNQTEPTYKHFYKKYICELKQNEPLYWGYLFHLYTDYVWNQDYYGRVKKTDVKKKSAIKLKEIKHHDFNNFNSNFKYNTLTITHIDTTLAKLKNIAKVESMPKDLQMVQEYLNKTNLVHNNYLFYQEKDLNKLMTKTITGFNKIIKDIKK